MNSDRVVRVWAEAGRQSGGSPISVAHVCAAAAIGASALALTAADVFFADQAPFFADVAFPWRAGSRASSPAWSPGYSAA